MASSTLARLGKAALGGAVAAMAMSGMRNVTTEAGLVRRVPPEEVMKKRATGLMRRLPRPYRRVAIELAHWSYGAFGGAVYELMPERVRRSRVAGPLYGVGLWVFFEFGLAPLLGLRRPRERDAVERIAFTVDHVLYGSIVSGPDWAE